MNNWNSIATAPKDRLIDVWNGANRVSDCYWDHICQEWRTSRPAGGLHCFKHATHWMEVPSPPIEDHPMVLPTRVGMVRQRDCAAARDVQLKYFYGVGYIAAPTDAAWHQKLVELGMVK